MFYALSKSVGILFSDPFIWLFILLIYFIWKLKNKAIAIGLIFIIWLFSLQGFANLLLMKWEYPIAKTNELNKLDYAVVLGGVTSTIPIENRPSTSNGADRLMHTVWLYKNGYIKYIIVSGGFPDEFDKTEAHRMKEWLILAGVPKSKIHTETNAKNTYQNASFSKELLDSLGNEKEIYVVTSAFHMYRTSACFSKLGVNHLPFPTDYRGKYSEWQDWIFPSAMAWLKLNILVKEWVGISAYKVNGYL